MAYGWHVDGRREWETADVKYYDWALQKVDDLSEQSLSIHGNIIRLIHAIAVDGRYVPSGYRDGQSNVRDVVSRRTVYIPPRAVEIPQLMKKLVRWINKNLVDHELPVPLVAALVHYQLATICPFYEGNGRTARLFATLILRSNGHGLLGMSCLEEYYARNLNAYFDAFDVEESHSYCLQRAEADVTDFVAYFCRGMVNAFAAVRLKLTQAQEQENWSRKLDPRERQLVVLLKKNGTAIIKQIAEHLYLSSRTVTALCRQ